MPKGMITNKEKKWKDISNLEGNKRQHSSKKVGKISGLTNEKAELTIMMLLSDTKICELRKITWMLLQVIDA